MQDYKGTCKGKKNTNQPTNKTPKTPKTPTLDMLAENLHLTIMISNDSINMGYPWARFTQCHRLFSCVRKIKLMVFKTLYRNHLLYMKD